MPEASLNYFEDGGVQSEGLEVAATEVCMDQLEVDLKPSLAIKTRASKKKKRILVGECVCECIYVCT